jgi:hypothetical protein
VLPHRLHGAVAPAVALAPEALPGARRLGPGPGTVHIDHSPAGPADGHGQVGVLGQGLGGDVARGLQRVPVERAQRTRYGRHALRLVEDAAVEVERDHVLDVLPAPQQAAPVGHLGVAGDRADPLLPQRLHEQGDRVPLDDGVAVDHHEDVLRRRGEPAPQGTGLAGVLLPDQPDGRAVRVAPLEPVGLQPVDQLGGAVGRPVVHDDDLERRITVAQQRSYRRDDVRRLVVRRDDDRHRGPPLAARLPVGFRVLPPVLPPGVPAGADHLDRHPGQRQSGHRQQEPEQRVRGPAGQALGRGERPAVQPVRTGRRRHRWARRAVGGQADRDGDEMMGHQQGRDHHVQCGQCLAAVAAAVVQDGDGAVAAERGRLAGNRLVLALQPVLGVQIAEHRGVAPRRGQIDEAA